MNILVSKSYDLKWVLPGTSYYWTQSGKCFNGRTGREIKKTVCGGSIGYCIIGKFQSVKLLRSKLEKIKNDDCPF